MINVFGSSFDETELESLRDSIASGWLGIGPKVRLFESDFEKKV
jgi:dTDP-4-amino-4,6-dideoxygalactose transaminase